MSGRNKLVTIIQKCLDKIKVHVTLNQPNLTQPNPMQPNISQPIPTQSNSAQTKPTQPNPSQHNLT